MPGATRWAEFTLIAAVLLSASGRNVASLFVLLVAGFIKDSFSAPYAGYNLFVNAACALYIRLLCDNMFKSSFYSRLFILAAAALLRELTYLFAAYFFYWGKTVKYIPWDFPLKIIFTALWGAIILRVATVEGTKVKKWLRAILQKA